MKSRYGVRYRSRPAESGMGGGAGGAYSACLCGRRVCVRACLCVRAGMCVRVRACMRACADCAYVRVRVRACVRVRARAYERERVRMRARVRLCVPLCACAHTWQTEPLRTMRASRFRYLPRSRPFGQITMI